MPAHARAALAPIVLACALAATAAAQDVDAGTDARDACGAAAFAAAETAGTAFDTFTIQVPPGLPVTERMRRLPAEIQAASRRASSVADGYESVIACRSPRWTMAALERQAEVYETLQRAIRAAAGSTSPDPRVLGAIARSLDLFRCFSVDRRVLGCASRTPRSRPRRRARRASTAAARRPRSTR